MGDTPTQGVNQALLASQTDGSVNPLVTPGSGVTESALESALGMPAGSVAAISGGSTVVSASGIGQSVSLMAGQTVSFQWDFLTNQTYNDGLSDSIAPTVDTNDFSFFAAVIGGSVQTFKLADTFYGYQVDPGAPGGFKTGLVLTASDNPFISETMYQTFTWKVATTGTYMLDAGVAHITAGGDPDDGINSALLVDNFQVVPEPSTFATLGLLSIGLLWRRRVR